MIWLTLINKLKLSYVLILITTALLFLLFFKQCQLDKANEKASDFNALYKSEKSKVTQFKKNGNSYSQKEAAVIGAKSMKYSENDEVKALKKEVGNLRKNLISYSRVSTITSGHLRAKLHDTLDLKRIDGKPWYSGIDSLNKMLPSLKGKSFSFKDNYLTFNGLISGDSLYAEYTIRSPFLLYYYYKRPGKGFFKLFRKKNAIAEIKFENQNSSADTLYTEILTREKSIVSKLIGH